MGSCVRGGPALLGWSCTLRGTTECDPKIALGGIPQKFQAAHPFLDRGARSDALSSSPRGAPMAGLAPGPPEALEGQGRGRGCPFVPCVTALSDALLRGGAKVESLWLSKASLSSCVAAP